MPQAARAERSSDRFWSLVLSVLLHGGLFAAVAYSWWNFRNDHPAPTLAIEATVVDAKSVPGIGKLPPQPEAPPPPPQPDSQPQVEPEGPPQPTPEELARREEELKQQAEHENQAKQAEQAKQLEQDRQREEQERQQEQALAEEKAAQEKREAQQKQAAVEKAEADRKAEEAKKRAEEKRLAEAQQKAEAQANAEREADLQRSLNQELHQDQLRNSGAVASWVSLITARITANWDKPPSVRSGLVCVLDVTQAPGGTVTNVRIGSCNGDAAVKESIQTAVYKASPLPPPPDPSLFQRELVITFRPN